MRHLYKTSAIVGIIIVIELLKKLSGIVWPFRPFHTFFSSLQLTLLLWLLVSLIMDLTFFRKLPARKAIRKTTFGVLVSLGLLEVITLFALHHPEYIPEKAAPTFRHYYDVFERRIIQFDPNSARYDSGLFYTLTPVRKFHFCNLEFDTDYLTNSKGLRDDETSLYKPEIIVLGDSYAMGWGVEQEETFSEQIAKLTNKKVLNAGISSFGTVRELKLLDRLDTSGLKYLIIQYCTNDLEENKRFIDSNYRLPTSDYQKYQSAVTYEHWNKQYFPGKAFTTVLKSFLHTRFRGLAERILPKANSMSSAALTLDMEVQNFLDVLYHSGVNFQKTKVLVIDLPPRSQSDDPFKKKADSLKNQGRFKEKFNNNLQVVSMAQVFTKEDYLVLDPHFKSSGHKKIANLLTPYLTR